jgi:hypothetical protein
MAIAQANISQYRAGYSPSWNRSRNQFVFVHGFASCIHFNAAVSRSYCMGLSYCMPRRFRIASELKASRQSSRKSHKEDVGGGRATPTGARQWRPRRREKEPGATCNMKNAVSSKLVSIVLKISTCNMLIFLVAFDNSILLKIHMHMSVLSLFSN